MAHRPTTAMLADLLTKDLFFYVPFGIDVLLCAIQWPMFMNAGSAGMLDMLFQGDSKDKIHSSPGYVKLFDLFMLCYTGYCAMFFYGLYSVVQHPGLIPAMACVQTAVILAKLTMMHRWGNAEDNSARAGKDASLWVYVSLYTCYHVSHFLL